jgi:hypothetical protein
MVGAPTHRADRRRAGLAADATAAAASYYGRAIAICAAREAGCQAGAAADRPDFALAT